MSTSPQSRCCSNNIETVVAVLYDDTTCNHVQLSQCILVCEIRNANMIDVEGNIHSRLAKIKELTGSRGKY